MAASARSTVAQLARLLEKALRGKLTPLERKVFDKATRWYLRELKKAMRKQREEETLEYPELEDPLEDDDDTDMEDD